jgi:hypothetical protein
MARKYTKLGLTYSDVIDRQIERMIAGKGTGARTAQIHIYLGIAAAERLHAADEDVCAFYKRPDHIRIARDSIAKARAWRTEIAEPRAA